MTWGGDWQGAWTGGWQGEAAGGGGTTYLDAEAALAGSGALAAGAATRVNARADLQGSATIVAGATVTTSTPPVGGGGGGNGGWGGYGHTPVTIWAPRPRRMADASAELVGGSAMRAGAHVTQRVAPTTSNEPVTRAAPVVYGARVNVPAHVVDEPAYNHDDDDVLMLVMAVASC